MPNITIKITIKDEENPRGKETDWTFFVNSAYPLEDNAKQLRIVFSENFVANQLLKEIKELSNGKSNDPV